MFNYYLNKRNTELSYPIKKYSKWDWIKRRYLFDFYKTKDYYRNRIRAVDNKSMISRLVDVLKESLGLPVYSYLKSVDANARLTSKQFNITSNINYGELHKSEVYGDNSYEAFLYTDTEIDIDYIEHNWRDIASLKIIYNSNTDLDFLVPFNQNKNFKKATLTVFEIDVVKMLLQYYYWAKEQTLLGNSVNTNVFIATVIYPNVLDSYMDMAIFNRFLAIANDIAIDEFITKQPYTTIDYSAGVDRILSGVVKDVKNQSIPLAQLLDSVPMLVKNNANELLYIDNKYYTVQSKWVLYISRLKYVLLLITLMGKKGRSRNRDLLTTLPAYIKQIERSSVVVLNSDDNAIILEKANTVEQIKKIVGRR